MSRTKTRAPSPRGLFLLAALVVGCGGGRSSAWQDDSEANAAGGWEDTPLGSGGSQTGGRIGTATLASGGAIYMTSGGSGGYFASTGGRITGGYPNTGGYPSTGGYPNMGGGYSTGGTPGAGGYVGIGGKATGGLGVAGKPTGGYGSVGAGNAGRDANGGVAGSLAGEAGLAGAAGAAGSLLCTPRRASVTSTTGSAGAPSNAEWYVDAQIGSDVGPGTKEQPLRTLSCASSAALTGDTVNLLDGRWDPNVEPKLAPESSLGCGIESGIAFAPNVTLRAVTPGAARIVGGGSHGLCMSGGVVEGIRFECASVGGPVLETQQGSLEIRGSSLKGCGAYGLSVSGNAQVSMSPGGLTDYAESENACFAHVREQGQLAINGGKLSFASAALQLNDSAQLSLHGVTIASQTTSSLAGYAVIMSSGSPRLLIDGNTRIENVAVAINVTTVSAEIAIDGLTFSQGVNALQATLSAPDVVSKVTIDRLAVVDCSGFGVSLNGKFALSITNSEFTRCGAPAIMSTGSGTVNLDTVAITGGWGGPIVSGDEASEVLLVKVRNLQTTAGQNAGPIVVGHLGDSFDFGTATSPGNNVFRGNNTLASASFANFIFAVPSGMVLQAVGNTWDANQQDADAAGHYSTGISGAPYDLATGSGPNVLSSSTNAGVIRLAENPPTGG